MATKVRNVFCFGDSMVCGIGAYGQSWPRHLEQDYYMANGHEPVANHPNFYALGVPGDTAERLEGRLGEDLKHRLHARYRSLLPTLSVVSIGNNDSFVTLDGESRPRTPKDSFAQRIGSIVSRLVNAEQDHQMIYVGLTACDDAMVHERKGEKIGYDNSVLREYEAIACDVVERHGGLVVPLLDASLQVGFNTSQLVDGVHPCAAGHEWIYEQVKPVFSNNL